MEIIAMHCQGLYVLWKPALFVSLLWKELGYFFLFILIEMIFYANSGCILLPIGISVSGIMVSASIICRQKFKM